MPVSDIHWTAQGGCQGLTDTPQTQERSKQHMFRTPTGSVLQYGFYFVTRQLQTRGHPKGPSIPMTRQDRGRWHMPCVLLQWQVALASAVTSCQVKSSEGNESAQGQGRRLTPLVL